MSKNTYQARPEHQPKPLHERFAEADKRQPKYSKEQVARRRRAAAIGGGVVLGIASLVVLGEAVHQSVDKTKLVNATITFGPENYDYSQAADEIDAKYEHESLNRNDLVDQMSAARSAQLGEQGQASPSPTDIKRVFAGETLTIQIPLTDEISAAMRTQSNGVVGQLDSIRFSPLLPPKQ